MHVIGIPFGKRIIEIRADDDLVVPRRFGRSLIAVSRAIGLPALAIVISSPAWTRARRREKCVFASWMLTWVPMRGIWT